MVREEGDYALPILASVTRLIHSCFKSATAVLLLGLLGQDFVSVGEGGGGIGAVRSIVLGSVPVESINDNLCDNVGDICFCRRQRPS